MQRRPRSQFLIVPTVSRAAPLMRVVRPQEHLSTMKLDKETIDRLRRVVLRVVPGLPRRVLAELLGVEWAAAGIGPFAPVYVNDGLTLDFINTDEPFPIYHFCFRVSDQEFDAILSRIKAAGIPYRSEVRGPVDYQINTYAGGRGIYWNEPDGHQWEILTVSYARPNG